MQLSSRSIDELAKVVAGDTGPGLYRSGPQLVAFFNRFGFSDEYGQGFPTRWRFAQLKVQSLNGTVELVKLIRDMLDPREWLNCDDFRDEIAQYLNRVFKFDNYEIVPDGDFYKVRALSGVVLFLTRLEDSNSIDYEFIEEQSRKCDVKLAEGDFDGAITNARSLLEAVLVGIEKEIDSNAPQYDGDLMKLYRRVQSGLNLEPSRKDIAEPLKQVLSGLVSIVSGLGGLRNKMSDSHARSYRPSRHHAVLLVNAAKTLASFLFDTKRYQVDRGIIDLQGIQEQQ